MHTHASAIAAAQELFRGHRKIEATCRLRRKSANSNHSCWKAEESSMCQIYFSWAFSQILPGTNRIVTCMKDYISFISRISWYFLRNYVIFFLNVGEINYNFRFSFFIDEFLTFYLQIMFGAPMSISYFIATVSGCDGGNRTRNTAVNTWRLKPLSYSRHPGWRQIMFVCTGGGEKIFNNDFFLLFHISAANSFSRGNVQNEQSLSLLKVEDEKGFGKFTD